MTQIEKIGWHTNCYLLATARGCVLIDTGFFLGRARLERGLAAAGCVPGSNRLALVVLTHGDSDHAGNAAYLQRRYGAPIAMHPADVPMVEQGEMYATRTVGGRLARAFLSPIMRMRPCDCFTPDVLLNEGDSLAPWGLDATVLHLPGHTPGSIGILTAEGHLFSGDLITQNAVPGWRKIVDDPAEVAASIARVRAVLSPDRVIYPGHRKPFPLRQLSGRLEE